jgi:NitT/TauT family transport system ATP-binding protein
MQPTVLFMDEPFSALDVLTAENLRGEIDDLWNAGNFPSQSIVIVTHNIEEAVILADRVAVLGANPGVIRGEVTVDLPRPHNRNDQRFQDLVAHLYTIMTNPAMSIEAAAATPGKARSPFSAPLPHVRVGGISGLLELVADEAGGCEEIAGLAERLGLPVDDLLAIIDAANMLGFATVAQGEVTLTQVGRDFATTTILRSKDLFRQQLLERVPVFSSIVKTLEQKQSRAMPAGFFLDIWDEYFPQQDARRQFETAVDWGRYAELLEYDAHEDILRLPEATAELAAT